MIRSDCGDRAFDLDEASPPAICDNKRLQKNNQQADPNLLSTKRPDSSSLGYRQPSHAVSPHTRDKKIR